MLKIASEFQMEKCQAKTVFLAFHFLLLQHRSSEVLQVTVGCPKICIRYTPICWTDSWGNTATTHKIRLLRSNCDCKSAREKGKSGMGKHMIKQSEHSSFKNYFPACFHLTNKRYWNSVTGNRAKVH